jgi:pyruvate-formate lyase-activating enzyme
MSTDALARSTATELLRFQRLAWTNLVFSLTRRCPLRCAHCITSSGPESSLPVVDQSVSERWAGQLLGLAELGLRSVTFTGGEPTLAVRQVTTLARAAHDAGLRTALVTSGSWGASDKLAERLLSKIGGLIDSWDFGYDSFHAEHLPLDHFIRAVRAASHEGADVAVRICDRDPQSTPALLDALASHLPQRVVLIVQPVHAIGRAAALAPTGEEKINLRMPCLATGPFVREDGSVGPCCAALGYGARGAQPFEYGPADQDGLLVAWRRWRNDPLLRLIRLVGFALPLRWLEEEALLDGAALETGHICETCERLWDSEGRAAAVLRRRAADPMLGALLDQLEIELYGSVWSESDPRSAREVMIDPNLAIT